MSKKRDSLIATGERLFIKHGMSRVSVEEVCRQTGVSKPTFYSHFENKADLGRRIAELWLEEGIKRIDEIQVAQIPFTAKLQQILDVRQEFAVRPGPEFFEDLIRLDIDMSHILESVMGFFTHSQARGDIRGDVPPQVLLAAYNSLNSLQHDPRIRELYKDSESLATDVFTLFYYGALQTAHREAGPSNGAGRETKDEMNQ